MLLLSERSPLRLTKYFLLQFCERRFFFASHASLLLSESSALGSGLSDFPVVELTTQCSGQHKNRSCCCVQNAVLWVSVAPPTVNSSKPAKISQLISRSKQPPNQAINKWDFFFQSVTFGKDNCLAPSFAPPR